jgi:ABC-2 type transport system permease protein
MKGFTVMVRKELLEQWRTAKLPVVAVIFLILGLMSPLFAKYLPELIKNFATGIQITVPQPTTKDAIAQFLKNLGQFGPLAGILLAMGMVAGEKEHRTAVVVLTKPLSRQAFLAAKLIALLATLGTGVILAGIACYIYTALLFEVLSVGGFIACCLLLLLATLVYAVLTLLGSTLVNSSLPAAGLGLAGLMVVTILSAIPGVSRFMPGSLYDAAQALALGQQPTELIVPLLSNLTLVALAMFLAWFSFRRQEL